MQLGTFKAPDIRLDIVISETLKEIYESVKMDEIQSKDLSQLLGYKFGTEPTLFKKINSMLAYGILEGGKGIYKITKLGEDLLFPEPDKEQDLKIQAIINVPLWRKLFEKNQRELPKNGLWVQLKNITEVDPATAKKAENRISNWYAEDMELVPEDFVLGDKNIEQVPQTEPIRSSSTQNTPMQQQLISPPLPSSEDNELIQFGKVSLSLPKKDLKKQWGKLQKYMEIYLEDYVEESIIEDTSTEEPQVIVDDIEPIEE